MLASPILGATNTSTSKRARVSGPIAQNAGLKATNLSLLPTLIGRKEPQHQANCVQASPTFSNRFVIMKMGEADLKIVSRREN